MNNKQMMKLCLDLIKADTEDEVVALLRKVGFWEDASAWRSYGDYENNYNTIGNQMSSPDAALIEKIVNAVDARLMSECLVRGIDPEGPAAPQTIRDAVARFFDENVPSTSSRAGRVQTWSKEKRTRVARGITVAATGATARRGKPSFTISDCGEGQTPEDMPNTLLSLTKSNKLRIPFVQGKFNMGGTGVLRHCGWHNLQLIVTRRNPTILGSSLDDPSDTQWGFTIVRRESPEEGRRSSVYTYLAPVRTRVKPNKGGVLRFTADTMPIFPEGKTPYMRESEWGALVKLYEYAATGFKSHMLMKDGLLSKADILLPDVALPVRFHECRGYRGHAGSPETTLAGLSVRLNDDNANLEFAPSSSSMSIGGERMTATIYAFKKGKAETYRKSEGIIFTLNGQTHGDLPAPFFRRKAVGLSYIADSILVIVDCSQLSVRAREDLFMNSRDRLSKGELRTEIESKLEYLLKQHSGLRALKEQRRRDELKSRLQDSKPLKDTLESLLKRSPTLSALFLEGRRISVPFKTRKARTDVQEFEGKKWPTFFRFRGKEYATILQRTCAINMRCRIAFETDAVNDYFSREIDRGEFSLLRIVDKELIPVASYVMHLHEGRASLSVQLPDNCREMDILQFVAVVNDSTQVEPFRNEFRITVGKPASSGQGGGRPRKSLAEGKGDEGEVPSGIALPNVIEVGEEDWEKENPPFDRYTALRIKNAGLPIDNGDNGHDREVYDFYVNVNNLYLKNELKHANRDPEITRNQFIFGQVLLGLALLHDETVSQKTSKATVEQQEARDDGLDGEPIEEKVECFSRAVAPFLVPMIESLGALSVETVSAGGSAGQDT